MFGDRPAKEWHCERCGKKFKVNCMYPKTRLPKFRTPAGKLIKNPLLCVNCRKGLINFLAKWWIYQK